MIKAIIVDYYGGLMLYFLSKRSVVRSAKNRVIRKEFNGGNFRDLATRFGISEMQVRNIKSNYILNFGNNKIDIY